MTRYMIAASTVAILSLAYLLARAETDVAREAQDHAVNGYAAPQNLRIAVVDIAALWKQNQRQNDRMDKLRAKVKMAEQELIAHGAGEQPAFSAISEGKSQYDILRDSQAEQLMREENTIYWDTMQSINREIERCAARHKIDIVFKINRDPVDKNDRNEILRGINAPIPYVNRKLDITEEVRNSLAASEKEIIN